MPGLALATGPLAGSGDAIQLLAGLTRDDYRSEQIIEPQPGMMLAFAGPPSYPLMVERADGVACALEGAVYGRSGEPIGVQLRRLASLFARDRDAARKEAEAMARSADGDFVLVIADARNGHALVVNDRLGRLPLYCSSRAGAAAVAREVKFVREIVGAGDVDRIALAQLLMFSFPLGDRTMHERITRVPEASSVAIDAAGSLELRRYYRWDFEQLASAGGDGKRTADELSLAFVDRCAAQGAWSAGRPLVVAMSGGLDSRSVGAGLSRAGLSYECVTFESGRRGATEETATAESIAKALGAPWRLYSLAAPSWEDSGKLARRCDGTTNVGMAFMYEFFERLRADFGSNVCQVTGDGGDRALPDLTDRAPCANREAFAARLVDGALWPLETVARLLKLSPHAIVESIASHVAAYPESGAAWWTVRHLIADYGWGRIFSGEDRSRSFVWTMTPFYCQSFFEAAMRAPARLKRDYALYADFLRQLDSRVAEVKKSDWGYAPTSPLVRFKSIAEMVRAGTPAPLKRALGSLRRPRSEANAARTKRPEFLAAVQSRPNGIFDRKSLDEIARRGCGKTHFHMLATAMLYVDGIWREPATAL
jgi:asparagine synthase (glutamine-hydrolysing)